MVQEWGDNDVETKQIERKIDLKKNPNYRVVWINPQWLASCTYLPYILVFLLRSLPRSEFKSNCFKAHASSRRSTSIKATCMLVIMHPGPSPDLLNPVGPSSLCFNCHSWVVSMHSKFGISFLSVVILWSGTLNAFWYSAEICWSGRGQWRLTA